MKTIPCPREMWPLRLLFFGEVPRDRRMRGYWTMERDCYQTLANRAAKKLRGGLTVRCIMYQRAHAFCLQYSWYWILVRWFTRYCVTSFPKSIGNSWSSDLNFCEVYMYSTFRQITILSYEYLMAVGYRWTSQFSCSSFTIFIFLFY